MTVSIKKRCLLRSLNLFGLDHLDPVILASLADCKPLLLIGRHGTAKSELLNRIAGALKLRHRHYNASLIAFDDLLGFPVPNPERSGLTYLRTEGDLWDAQSVLLDEISRCRPEHQNKLFSIIHERRIQGLLLDQLSYRWSAMNPPVSLDSLDEERESYQGSLPLDTALADRFAYIVEIPEFNDFSLKVRKEILSKGGSPPDHVTGLESWLEEARELLKRSRCEEIQWIEDYVNQLILPLKKGGWPISGRRAVGLTKSISAIHAACKVLKRDENLQDAAFIALKWGLPQRTQGISISISKLKAIHKSAVKAAGLPEDNPLLKIQTESDTVRRIALALETPKEVINRIEFSQLVTDAYAGLSVPERYILARQLLPVLSVNDRATAATYELLSEPLEKVCRFTLEKSHSLSIHRGRVREWNEVLEKVSRIGRSRIWNASQLCNILYTLFSVENESFDSDRLVALDKRWHRILHKEEEKKAAA